MSSSSYSSYLQAAAILGIATIVCLIIAFVGGIVLFFTFLAKRNENHFTGFLGWLYDFLHFKKFLAEALLKIIYTISAGFITLYSVAYLLFAPETNFGIRFLYFLGVLVIGNVVIRIGYEFILIQLILCKNTIQINEKLGKLTGDTPKDDGKITFNGGYDDNRRPIGTNNVNRPGNYGTNYGVNQQGNRQPNINNTPYPNGNVPKSSVSVNSGETVAINHPANDQENYRSNSNTICRNCGRVVDKNTGVCKYCGSVLK